MLVVGAKGLAQEILQIFEELNNEDEVFFFDDVNLEDEDILFDRFKVLRKTGQIKALFENDNRFVLGLGNPRLRKLLYEKFSGLGGVLTGLKSKDVYIGKYTSIEKSATLMSGVKVSNGVTIGKALLAYYNVIITHDVKIGDFVELSPGCKLLGHVYIEDQVHIGTGAVVLPKTKIGKGAIVGAGAVVTKNVLANTTVLGNPARVK